MSDNVSVPVPEHPGAPIRSSITQRVVTSTVSACNKDTLQVLVHLLQLIAYPILLWVLEQLKRQNVVANPPIAPS